MTPSSRRAGPFTRRHVAASRNAGPFDALSIALRPAADAATRSTTAPRTSGIHGRAFRHMPGLEQARVAVGRRQLQVGVARRRDDPAAGRALEEAELEQVRLVDVLDACPSPRRSRRPASTGRPARPRTARRSPRRIARSIRSSPAWSTSKSSSASIATACVISPSWRTCAKSRTRRRMRFATRGVPRERRAISAAPSGVDAHVEEAGRSLDDALDLGGLVVVEPVGDPEAVAERRGQKPGARRRADERERLQLEAQRVRAGALADDDVDAAVLHRRIEQLLDRPVQPVDLVDEEDVVGLERGQDRGHVGLAVDGRAGHDAQRRAHLGRR